MSRVTKNHPVVITSIKGKSVRALVSTWDVVDFQGDRVRRGAFANSIAEWETSGDRLPFLWSHEWADPFAHLGLVTAMRETDRGLEVEAEILDDNEFAQQVKRLIGQRRVTQYSFAYDVIRENRLEDGSNELLELKLIECGPCLSGANPNTDTLSRKSVQEMLAREAGTTTGWAGTSIPKGAVDELRNKVSGVVESFLDDLYDAAPKETPMTDTPKDHDADIRAKIAETWHVATDADLRKQLDELKAAGPRGAPDPTGTGGVLTRAATLLMQSAVSAQRAGLPTEESVLMQAARDLFRIASGHQGDVQAIIDACTPIIAALRTAGRAQSGDNLERTLTELSALVPKSNDDIRSKIAATWPGTLEKTEPERPRRPAPILGNAPRVDSRMRPVEPAAAIPVESDEPHFQLPVYEVGEDTWRVEQ